MSAFTTFHVDWITSFFSVTFIVIRDRGPVNISAPAGSSDKEKGAQPWASALKEATTTEAKNLCNDYQYCNPRATC